MSTTNFDRYDLQAKGDNAKEDFTDLISNLTPSEFLFQANIKDWGSPATNTLREWQLRERRAANASNKLVDGGQFTTSTQTSNAKVGNMHQISFERIDTSRTAEIIEKAGRGSEMGFLLAEAGVSVKNDLEVMMLSDQVSVRGSSTVARTTAGLQTWIKTNVDGGVGATEAALSNTTYGEPTVARVGGTAKALSLAGILTQVRATRTKGGHTNMLFMSDDNKANFSEFMLNQTTPSARIAAPTQDHGANPRGGVSVVGSVDVFVSDTAIIDVVPSLHCPDDVVFGLDTDYLKMSYFDGWKTKTIETDTDGEAEALHVDWGLMVQNEASCFMMADIDSTTPMVA